MATVAAVAWQLGISPAEHRELEAGDAIPDFDTGNASSSLRARWRTEGGVGVRFHRVEGPSPVRGLAPHERARTDVTDFLTILPMAVVMVAGPQIVSAVFLAMSERARRDSIAYVLGVALAVVLGVTLVYTVARLLGVSAPSEGDSGKGPVDYVIIALLLFLAVRVFIRRNESEPPKWMGKLATATPRFAFKLGFLLFLLMPTDVITMVVVGMFLARRDDPLFYAIPFILLTLLIVSIPLIVLLILGERAQTILPKVRAWMNANSWIVSEVVIVFFLILFIF